MGDLLERHKEKMANEIFSEHKRALSATLKFMLERENIVGATAYGFSGEMLASTEDATPKDLELSESKTLLRPTATASAAPTRVGPKEGNVEPAGALMAETVSGNEKVLSFTMPVEAYGEVVGFCSLKQALGPLNLETYKIIGIFSALLLSLLMIMTVMLNVLMTRSVLRPLYRLKSVMLRIGPRQNTSGDKAERPLRFQSMTDTLTQMASDLSLSIGSTFALGAGADGK
jgi:hypothetical protein